MKGNLRRPLAILLALVLVSTDICAIAEATAMLNLPSALQIIDEEAFYGSTSIEKVVVPDGTTEIRSKAFANSSITELVLPDSLTFIAEDAFAGCGEFALNVPENCYAYDRCVELGLIKLEEPDPSVIESAHPYADNFDYTWTYDAGEGTESVTITFSADTETEEDYDFIYLYTLDDVEVGKYSGKELASQSITIDGSGFKLRLTSDEAWGNGNTYYGFRLDNIVPLKAVPLIFDSITAESSTVSAGETIRWMVATTGGKAPVYYDYTVLLGEKDVASGTVEAPNAIEYTPARTGEYKLSVIVHDSADVVLPAQVSEALTVAPSTVYPESAHPYSANVDQSWIYAAEDNVESLIITFSEETKTQSGRDYIYFYDQNGTEAGKYSGTELAGQTIEIMGSAFTIRLTSNGSTQYYGFTITNIEKYIPGPLEFVSLTADKSKAKTGDLITWTMETTGGRRPVTYEYTISLNSEILRAGSVIRPELIEYVPTKAGDYTISVTARDAAGSELPEQTSQVRIAQREVAPEEDFTYEAIDGLYARITSYTGTDTAVIVPETVGEYTVREIGNGAFRDNASLLSVMLPDSVTTVAANAFRNCDALRDVDLGQCVTTIGADAFNDCDALRFFTFPDSVTATGGSVLRYCDNLEDVTFSANWASAGEYTVADCPKLTKIDLPEGLSAVPNYAFRYCANLKEITLCNTILTIGEYAFGGCTGVKSIEFPEGLTAIAAYAFENCTGFTAITLPSTVVSVSGFAGCSNLADIELNDGLNAIGDNAFRGCTSLTDIDFPVNLESVGINAFKDCSNLKAAILPDSVTGIGNNAFENCTSMSQFHYPASFENVIRVNQLNDSSYGHIFKGCTSLKEITIPEGVTTIPEYTFRGATYITKFNLPSTLTEIGQKAFAECKGIQNFAFPANLKSVGISAFKDCSNLQAANLPDGVAGIGNNAFENCTSMSQFHYPASFENVIKVNQLNDSSYGHIFKGCTSLKEITIPEGITTIPEYTFRGATYVTKFNLPSTLTEIGQKAFAECKGIQNIAFPATLEIVGNSAFKDCTNLQAANLPDGVTGIGNNAFENCSSMSQFHYPASFENVIYTKMLNDSSYGHIFKGCTSLKEITIPEGVTTIPEYTFRGAASITKVYAPSTLTTIGKKAFAGCTAFEWIYLSPLVRSIGSEAFSNCSALTVWTEYGSYALQYVINNGIAYYYLTPDGANIPSGVLYKGDEYSLYGYARSSVNLTNVTATIWDSTGSTALQTVSIAPGITDYSLVNEINAGLDFAILPLGTYRYTLRASTDVSEEDWANSTFRIVPPPLRVSRIGLDVPYGFYSKEDSIPVSGTIIANYPITQITVGVYDDNDAPTTQVYTTSPNRTSFDLSQAGLYVNELPSGSYVFKIIVSGNGETVTAVCSDFTLSGAPSIDASSVDRGALSAFLANSENRRPFANVNYYGSLQASMTDAERLKYGMYTSDEKVRSGVIDFFLNGFGVNEHQRSEYLVTLYKEEITNYVKSQVFVYDKYHFKELDYEETITRLIEQHQFSWEQIQGDLGSAASNYEKEYIKAVNVVLKKLDWSVIQSAETMYEVLGCFYEAAQDYTNGIQILDALSADVLDPSAWNYNFQLAVSELKEEYTSKSLRLWNNLIKYATDKVVGGARDKITECVITSLLGGEVYIAYKIVDVVWTIYTEETGFYDDVALVDKYRAQVETLEAVYKNYTDCFDALANGTGGDASVAQLIQYFELTKSAAIRSIETLRRLPMHTRFVSDGELYRLTNEFQRMSCP